MTIATVHTTAPTHADGTRQPLSVTLAGAIRVTQTSADGTQTIVRAAGDGQSGTTGQVVNSQEQLFNGTTWDRAVSVQGAVGAGTGVQAVGVVATSNNNVTTAHRLLAAASTNATSVKSSAGKITGGIVSNTSAAAKYLKFYNKATAPTVGTDTPVMTILLPAGQNVELEFNTVFGLYFNTGIAYALTGAVADADTTALVANDVIVNLFYV